ncbi:multiubiquitin domain-containing protein [Mesorhizobium sp. M0933]|uniref:hypothetical protein n=1 Tax=Mesorhizobium sp. M0933 TaxID=2957030 RepID=UPI003335B204
MTEFERREIAEPKEEVAVLKKDVEVLEELIDLEEQAKEGKQPKKAKRYRLRIDKEKKVVEVQEMTGTQILGLVDKTPDKYLLSMKVPGEGFQPVSPEQTVVFHVHRVERFQTLALDPSEG